MARKRIRLRSVLDPERDVIDLEHGGEVLPIEVRTPDELPPASAILVDSVLAELNALVNSGEVSATTSDPLLERKIRDAVRVVTVDLPAEVEAGLSWRTRAEIIGFFAMRLGETRGEAMPAAAAKPAEPEKPTPVETKRKSSSSSSSRDSSEHTEATRSTG